MDEFETVDDLRLLRDLLGQLLPVEELPEELRDTQALDLILRDLEHSLDQAPSLLPRDPARRDLLDD